MSGNFGYTGRSNVWGDLDQMWDVGRYGGHNHVCNISWLSVKGCGCGERGKFAFSRWLDVSPLQHYRVTMWCQVTMYVGKRVCSLFCEFVSADIHTYIHTYITIYRARCVDSTEYMSNQRRSIELPIIIVECKSLWLLKLSAFVSIFTWVDVTGIFAIHDGWVYVVVSLMVTMHVGKPLVHGLGCWCWGGC